MSDVNFFSYYTSKFYAIVLRRICGEMALANRRAIAADPRTTAFTHHTAPTHWHVHLHHGHQQLTQQHHQEVTLQPTPLLRLKRCPTSSP